MVDLQFLNNVIFRYLAFGCLNLEQGEVDGEIVVRVHNAAVAGDEMVVHLYVLVDFHIVAAANLPVCNCAARFEAVRFHFLGSRICLSYSR